MYRIECPEFRAKPEEWQAKVDECYRIDNAQSKAEYEHKNGGVDIIIRIGDAGTATTSAPGRALYVLRVLTEAGYNPVMSYLVD